MSTLQVDPIKAFTLTKLSSHKSNYNSGIWNNAFLKKFITNKWPYEVYKGSLLQDFWTVLSFR